MLGLAVNMRPWTVKNVHRHRDVGVYSPSIHMAVWGIVSDIRGGVSLFFSLSTKEKGFTHTLMDISLPSAGSRVHPTRILDGRIGDYQNRDQIRMEEASENIKLRKGIVRAAHSSEYDPSFPSSRDNASPAMIMDYGQHEKYTTHSDRAHYVPTSTRIPATTGVQVPNGSQPMGPRTNLLHNDFRGKSVNAFVYS